MNGAERLRKAAALMRERAEPASTIRPAPWVLAPDGEDIAIWSEPKARLVGFGEYESVTVHMASWHPAVALAVADWLDFAAQNLEEIEFRGQATDFPPVRVANAYLGGEA